MAALGAAYLLVGDSLTQRSDEAGDAARMKRTVRLDDDAAPALFRLHLDRVLLVVAGADAGGGHVKGQDGDCPEHDLRVLFKLERLCLARCALQRNDDGCGQDSTPHAP